MSMTIGPLLTLLRRIRSEQGDEHTSTRTKVGNEHTSTRSDVASEGSSTRTKVGNEHSTTRGEVTSAANRYWQNATVQAEISTSTSHAANTYIDVTGSGWLACVFNTRSSGNAQFKVEIDGDSNNLYFIYITSSSGAVNPWLRFESSLKVTCSDALETGLGAVAILDP